MGNRVMHLLTTFALSVILLVLGAVLLYADVSAKTPIPSAGFEVETITRQATPTIFALRRISIPFGIEVPVHVNSTGSAVEIEGHAQCPSESTAFQVRTTVTQAATGAKAKSQYAAFACDASLTSWQAVADVQGPTNVLPGELADVCVMALFDSPKQGTTVFKWCYIDVAVSQVD